MKAIITTMLAALMLAASDSTAAQSHRHTPKASIKATIQTSDDTAGDTTAITAFSDTTNVADADNQHNVNMNFPFPFGNDTGSIAKDVFLPIAIVLIMFAITPIGILAILVYFLIKSRKQKLQLAELAIKNGQPIPGTIAKRKDENLWAKGLKNIFVGIGVMVMFFFLGATELIGIGAFISIYGIGQAVIAKTSGKKQNSTTGDAVDENSEDQRPPVVNETGDDAARSEE